MRRWGARPAEHGAPMPGDEMVADPAIVTTRAVTIDAPPEIVWSWLVQLGQDRGGMYSHDALENVLGLDIHSSDAIRPEWQHLTVGDRVVLVREGWPAMRAGYSLPVAFIDPPRTLVLRQSPPEHPWDAVWSFHVRPLPHGRSRLISRGRSHRHRGMRGALDIAVDAAMDPVTWFMTRGMLLGIRRRAEGDARNVSPGPSGASRPRPPCTWRGGSLLARRLDEDVAHLSPPRNGGDSGVLTTGDLDGLPDPARRYLMWMGVIGRPRVAAFRARFVGEFRMKPDGRWMPYESWQYNRARPVTRLVRMRIDAARLVPMFGSDTYVDHRGRMAGTVLGLIPVAEGEGPEFDLGELVTYVNDALLLAPTMLLCPAAVWRPIDAQNFAVVVTDGGNRVSARCTIDGDGRLVDFQTDDRRYAGTDPPTRAAWSTPLGRWVVLPDGVGRVPSSGSAVWHLPGGDFTYVRGAFDPESVTFEHAGSGPDVVPPRFDGDGA